MRLPKILSHIFDSDSKSVSFGWSILALASVFFAQGMIDADRWQFCVLVAAGLVGGKSIKEGVTEIATLKSKNDKKEDGSDR